MPDENDSPDLSDHGDLTPLANDIEALFEEYGLEDPAFGVAFTVAEHRQTASWVTNVDRQSGMVLFGRTAIAMEEQAEDA